MVKRAGSAVAARERARQARLRLDADRDARDKRVEEATAEVFVAQDAIVQADATLGDARRVRDRAVAAAEAGVGASLLRLRAEGLAAADLATVTGLDGTEVRRLVKLATAAEPRAAESDVS